MDIEAFRNYCIAKPGVSEEFPFDGNTLVFKVMGKMFALTSIDSYEGINLKCNPEMALELRERYAGVEPGYHMNKKHWNTVRPNTDVEDDKLKELIDHSYSLVVQGLPKKLKEELKNM